MHARSVGTDDEESASWCTDYSAPSEPGGGLRRLQWPNGALYEGRVNEEYLPHGEGELRTSRGEVFKGRWHQGWITGQGVFVNARGTRFCGELQRNQRNGEGTLTCADGAVYFGHWRDDMPDGQGTYVDEANGVNYKGSWRAGKAHGWGVLKVQSWGTYSGHFSEDKKHGQGQVTYNNGATYEGDWEGDDAHGWGEYHWPNGDVYQGEFHRGRMTGRGEYRSADGSFVFKGEWHQNKRKGMGHIVFSDGAEYDGEWADDRPEGLGVFKSPLGIIFRGVWRGGVFCSRSAGYDERGVPTVVVESGRYSLLNDDGHDVIHPAVVPGSPCSPDACNLPDPSIAWREGFNRDNQSREYDTPVYESRLYPADPCKLESGYMYRTRFHVRMWERDVETVSNEERESSLPIEMDATHRFGRQINTSEPDDMKDDLPSYQRNQAYPYKHRPILPSTNNVGDSAFILRPIMLGEGELNSSIPSNSLPTSSVYRDIDPASGRPDHVSLRSLEMSRVPESMTDREDLVPKPSVRNGENRSIVIEDKSNNVTEEEVPELAVTQPPSQSPWRPMSTQHYSLHAPDEDDTCEGSEKLEWTTRHTSNEMAHMRTVETTEVPDGVCFDNEERSPIWGKQDLIPSGVSDIKSPTPAPMIPPRGTEKYTNSPLETRRIHGPSSSGDEVGVTYRPPRPIAGQYHEPDKQVTLPDRVDAKEECVNEYLVGTEPIVPTLTTATPLITNNNYYYPTTSPPPLLSQCCCWCHAPTPEHLHCPMKNRCSTAKSGRKWQSVSSPLISFADRSRAAEMVISPEATAECSSNQGSVDGRFIEEDIYEESKSYQRRKMHDTSRESNAKKAEGGDSQRTYEDASNSINGRKSTKQDSGNASESEPTLKGTRRTSYANTSTSTWATVKRRVKEVANTTSAVMNERLQKGPLPPPRQAPSIIPKATTSFYQRVAPISSGVSGASRPPYIPPPKQIMAPRGMRARVAGNSGTSGIEGSSNRVTTAVCADRMISRRVPVPLEASSTVHFVLPRIRSTIVPVDVPVYAPRFVEVPVGIETLETRDVERCEAMAKKLVKAQRSGDGAALEDCANEINCLTAELRNSPPPVVDLNKFYPPADEPRMEQ